MASPVASTGVPTPPGPNGSVPVRREIRDLQLNYPEQFNLYLLGLVEFQKQPPAELLSYYQIAGIHGQPYVPWNAVKGDPSGRGGYCTHSSILFLTWHRPYLATFEQVLHLYVTKKAEEFKEPERAKYVAAAKQFRIPYWDWAKRITGDARNQISAFPTAFSSRQIEVTNTNGKKGPIPNPLYSFRFDDKVIPQELQPYGEWNGYSNTKRAPGPDGSSNNNFVAALMNNEAASLRNGVSQVLLSYRKFESVSNNVWIPGGSGSSYASLEAMHDTVHDKVGSTGHMNDPDVAAFDPVFWLHHTNVDRLWAIWQALNPNAYDINKTVRKKEVNFTMPFGLELNERTPLKPFYDVSGTNFWTSASSKWTTPFGYAYPETQSWNYANEEIYRSKLRQSVTTQYGANSISNFFANIAPSHVFESAAPLEAEKEDVPVQAAAVEPEQRQNFGIKEALQHPIKAAKQIVHHKEHQDNPEAKIEASNSTTPEIVSLNIPEKYSHLVPDRTYTEWITNIRAVKHGLSQPFRVFVFLGDFNENPAAWPTEYNVVGRFSVLGRDQDTGCEKCQRDQAEDLIVTGTVPLTSALLQDIVEGQLASLNPEDVVPYLEKNLHWRVTISDGSEKPRDEVPGLRLGVVSTSVRIGDDGIPIYSRDYTAHPTITDGRPAGLGGADDY